MSDQINACFQLLCEKIASKLLLGKEVYRRKNDSMIRGGEKKEKRSTHMDLGRVSEHLMLSHKLNGVSAHHQNGQGIFEAHNNHDDPLRAQHN